MVERFFDRVGKLGAAMLIGGVIGTRFVFVVDGGERALVMNKLSGLQNKVHGEGMHFKIPFIMSIRRFQVRAQPQMIHSETGTKDLQKASLSLRILYRPLEEKLPEILNNIGEDYAQRILPSIGNEVLKSIVALYNAEQLISQREKVSQEIMEVLQKRAREFDIVLDDVSITHLEFSHEYLAAIEAKQVAQQNAERAKFVVAIREQEMKAAVLRARGEAEAATLVAEAISTHGPGLVAVRKIEASQHIAKVLQASPNVTFLTGNTMNMINLSGGM